MRCLLGLVAGLAIALASAAPAGAHGTLNSWLLGQKAEHEKITRGSLGCAPDYTPQDDPGRCLELLTLDEVAGKEGRTGAVGAADIDEFFEDVPHCTNADYLPGGYPRSRARATAEFAKCRANMDAHWDEAVKLAIKTIDTATLDIRPAEVSLQCGYIDAVKAGAGLHDFVKKLDVPAVIDHFGPYRNRGARYVARKIELFFLKRFQQAAALYAVVAGNGIRGSAKCKVIGHLGRIFHAQQDFYSHSNWADRAEKGKPRGIHNPPGLGRKAPSPLLDMLKPGAAVPVTFSTSCYDLLHVACERRIDHDADMGKDKGRITVVYERDPLPNKLRTADPATPRGQVADNFDDAVQGAATQTAFTWTQFGEKLATEYGQKEAAQIICGLAHDDPVTACPAPAGAPGAVEIPGPAGGTGGSGCTGTFTGNVQTVNEPDDQDHPFDYRWVTSIAPSCDLSRAEYWSSQTVRAGGPVIAQNLGAFGFPGFDGFGGAGGVQPVPPDDPCYHCAIHAPVLERGDGNAWVLRVRVTGNYLMRRNPDGTPPRGQQNVFVRLFWRAGQ